jgi:hypothetical protein
MLSQMRQGGRLFADAASRVVLVHYSGAHCAEAISRLLGLERGVGHHDLEGVPDRRTPATARCASVIRPARQHQPTTDLPASQHHAGGE